MAFLDKIHPLLKRTRENKYSDSNYAVLNAIDKQLEEMELETIQSKSQSAIYTATGWFLDNAWGNWFGVKRKTGESDSDYRDRIIEKVNVPRGTVESVKYGIREFLENEYIGIEIYEPWEDIFYLNRLSSRLNGKHHLIGEYYNYGVMDITVGETFPKDMLDVIDLFKPAGVTVHVNVDTNLPSNDPNAEKDLLSTHKLNVYDSYKEYERTVGMFEGVMGKFSIFDKVSVIDGEDFVLRNGYVYGDEIVDKEDLSNVEFQVKLYALSDRESGVDRPPFTEIMVDTNKQSSSPNTYIGNHTLKENLKDGPYYIMRVYGDLPFGIRAMIHGGTPLGNNQNGRGDLVKGVSDLSQYRDMYEILLKKPSFLKDHITPTVSFFTDIIPPQGNTTPTNIRRVSFSYTNYSEDYLNPTASMPYTFQEVLTKYKDGTFEIGEVELYSIHESIYIPVEEGNYFNINSASLNTSIKFEDGSTFNENGSLTSDFIEVKPNTELESSALINTVATYDINKVYLGTVVGNNLGNSSSNTNRVSIPILNNDNIKYIRVNYRNNFINGNERKDIKVLLVEPDYSHLNDSSDLLVGNTLSVNGFEHVVGVGSDFNPSPNFRLQDLDEHTELKEPTELSLPNNNLGYIYTVFDLSHFYTNHKDKIIQNDRYSYIDYLDNNNFTLSLDGENGRTYEVEYYNFLNKEWELLERNLFKENTSIVSKKIDMHKALNDNLITILRVKTFNKQVTIEDMYLEYRYSKELPISVTGSNTGHSLTLSDEKLYNEVLPYG